MKWTKPKLYDLSDLKDSVAQGACAVGPAPDAVCNPGLGAETSCIAGTLFGSIFCDPGSAQV
jgi:hypothetical protein